MYVPHDRRCWTTHRSANWWAYELADWSGPALKSHKTAGHPLHKLAFVANLGLRR